MAFPPEAFPSEMMTLPVSFGDGSAKPPVLIAASTSSLLPSTSLRFAERLAAVEMLVAVAVEPDSLTTVAVLVTKACSIVMALAAHALKPAGAWSTGLTGTALFCQRE